MEEDALILKVIEAYCTSAKTRHTVNSCKYQGGVTLPRNGGCDVLMMGVVLVWNMGNLMWDMLICIVLHFLLQCLLFFKDVFVFQNLDLYMFD